MSAPSRAISTFSQTINPANLSRVAQRALSTAQRIQANSVKLYHHGRLLVTGPLRNGLLVGREFVRTVSTERQFIIPREQVAKEALSTYRIWWAHASNLVQTGRWQGELTNFLKNTTWKQAGNGALVVGEVLSLFYISKLALLSGKKTVKTVF